ncbi:hypothetical protein GII30_20175 [Gordonia amarae]|uniref:Mce family protein n=2 Tax=Gordonia amarae TaxID=36821 RepID=G7GMP0_9ACTN|nr:hypothetical protein [Gordonia amarae]MCS3880764.1 ABC-type transporter Mla subunit MlaD [Gordonia amarae]QHN19048.1 hypothetical protein GII35_20530 [Gordonia amarae]QHN23523.1 hypothetical protein GII34_20030 [Gordonia amarae]QHN32423.1 hypothetical protein GII32_20345 [Gordonia amarae]QHN41171.1 hypothetical protein GII30_20175 [Gordonia amarae]
MARHALTGITTHTHTARTVGIAAILVAALAVIGWRFIPTDDLDSGQIAVTLLAEEVGDGVTKGTEVRRGGVVVGKVDSVTRTDAGQAITVHLDRPALTGLTDALSIDYSPANLFGITQISLLAQQGGSPLRSGTTINLTGAQRDRVHDATVSTMLLSLGKLSGDVLTPDLADLLKKVAQDAKAFSPLMKALVTTVETVADTQKMPYSPILRDLGSALSGFPATLDGGLVLLRMVHDHPYLKVPEKQARFDATVAMLAKKVIPGLANLLEVLQPDYRGLAAMPVPLMNAVASVVSSPQTTQAQLEQLLTRTAKTFGGSPAEPVLRLALTLNAGGGGR